MTMVHKKPKVMAQLEFLQQHLALPKAKLLSLQRHLALRIAEPYIYQQTQRCHGNIEGLSNAMIHRAVSHAANTLSSLPSTTGNLATHMCESNRAIAIHRLPYEMGRGREGGSCNPGLYIAEQLILQL